MALFNAAYMPSKELSAGCRGKSGSKKWVMSIAILLGMIVCTQSMDTARPSTGGFFSRCFGSRTKPKVLRSQEQLLTPQQREDIIAEATERDEKRQGRCLVQYVKVALNKFEDLHNKIIGIDEVWVPREKENVQKVARDVGVCLRYLAQWSSEINTIFNRIRHRVRRSTNEDILRKDMGKILAEFSPDYHGTGAGKADPHADLVSDLDKDIRAMTSSFIVKLCEMYRLRFTDVYTKTKPYARKDRTGKRIYRVGRITYTREEVADFWGFERDEEKKYKKKE